MQISKYLKSKSTKNLEQYLTMYDVIEKDGELTANDIFWRERIKYELETRKSWDKLEQIVKDN